VHFGLRCRPGAVARDSDLLLRPRRGLGSYGYAVMAYTVPIVTLGNVETPLNTFDTGVARCSELILGVGCAYISSVLVARGTSAVRRELIDSVKAVAQDCVE